MVLRKLFERLGLHINKSVFFFGDENSNAPVFAPEIKKKLEIIQPDAYYSFNNQPYILFFDLSKEINSIREDDIHKRVWSFDYSPLIFILKDKEEIIYNAFSYNKKTERLKEIEFDNEESRDDLFSFWNLQSGETWRWIQEKKYKDSISKKRVNQKLFDNIKEVREKLGEDGFPEEDANILILRLIFIRYLIDRHVRIDPIYISGESVWERRRSLSELIINSEKLNLFFDYLNDRFNGVLFKNTNIVLSTIQASSLALVFNEKAEINTPTLFDSLDDFYFEIFDFSIIPVEVISGIYESLIDKEKKKETSAIYTPPFLVEYILNETVGKHHNEYKTSECRIFDPACGSGIFLVQSLRRMIDKEIEITGNSLSKREFIERIREIAKNNLFGIDINEQALKVACFSIYVALLDYQIPKDIDRYEFPSLIGENLFEANFFKDTDNNGVNYKKIIDSKNIDYILGNPPWKSTKEKNHVEYIKSRNLPVARYEIAQTFMFRANDFQSKKKALVVTSKAFYNIWSKGFKGKFLNENILEQFFDLSAVRRQVFEKAISPACIVIYRTKGKGELPQNNIVKHISIKSNIFLKYFKSIVIEKYDYKSILQKYFIDYQWMFKVALYGNTLDFQCLLKIAGSPLKNKFESDNQLFKGDGILKGTPKPKPFEFLVGKKVIEEKQVKQYFTPIPKELHSLLLEESYLESGRRPELFNGKHILLKAQTESESNIIVSYVDDSIVFRHDTYGITSKNENTLKELYSYLISKLYLYYQYLTSSSWGIATRPAIRLEEYLSFPYRELSITERDNLVDLTNSFLQPFFEYYNKDFSMGEPLVDCNILNIINDKINALYEISEVDEDLLDYVFEVSRFQFQESKQHKVLNFRNKEDDLKRYSEVFLKEFSNIYNNESLKIEVYPLNHFIAINFRFIKDKPIKGDQITIVYEDINAKEVLSFISNSLSIWNITDCKNPKNNIYIQKDIKGFEHDSFYIIKPNEYKCWHRAMAWYDVAEIKDAIEKAEFNHLKNSSDDF